MVYTLTPPTVPGWYWQKSNSGETIVQLFDYHFPVRTWEERKQSLLNAGGMTEETVAALDHLPDSVFFVYWCGPLEPPKMP